MSIIYKHHIFSICSCVDGQLVRVHVLALMNNTAVNMDVEVPPCRADMGSFRCEYR